MQWVHTAVRLPVLGSSCCAMRDESCIVSRDDILCPSTDTGTHTQQYTYSVCTDTNIVVYLEMSIIGENIYSKP